MENTTLIEATDEKAWKRVIAEELVGMEETPLSEKLEGTHWECDETGAMGISVTVAGLTIWGVVDRDDKDAEGMVRYEVNYAGKVSLGTVGDHLYNLSERGEL